MAKRPKKITNPIENPNIIDIKSLTTEHPKTSYQLSKTIRQTKKVGAGKNSTSLLDGETAKRGNFLDEKNVKLTKRSHAYKGCVSSSNIDVLISQRQKQLLMRGITLITYLNQSILRLYQTYKNILEKL